MADTFDRGPFSRGMRGLPTNLQGAPTRQPDTIKFLVIPGNGLANFPAGAIEKTFSHPVIIQGTALAGDNFAPSADQLLYALPTECMDPTNGFFTTADGIVPGIPSTNGCTLYLPAGTYFLYYAGPDPLNTLVIDATDPILAAQYMARPGCHFTSIPNIDQPDDVICPPLAITTIAPGNIRRKALFIQNVGAEVVRIAVGAGLGTNRGIRLTPFSYPPIVFAGATLTQQDVLAVPEGASDGVVSVMEFI